MPAPPDTRAVEVVSGADGSLLELVDHLLNQGVVISGEVVLGLADVDLVYLRLSALLCASDQVFGTATGAAKQTEKTKEQGRKKKEVR